MKNVLKSTESNITKMTQSKRLAGSKVNKFIFLISSFLLVNKVQATYIQKINFNNQTDYDVAFNYSGTRWTVYDRVYISPHSVFSINFEYPVKPKTLYVPLRVYNIRASISHLITVNTFKYVPKTICDIIEEMCFAGKTKELFLNTKLTKKQHEFVITYKGKKIFDISEET